MKVSLRKMAAVLGFLFGCLVFTGSIWAYSSDADTSDNVIAIGSDTTEIGEEFPDPVIPGNGGSSVKKVSVKNTGLSSCYVRAQVLFSDGSAEEKCTLDYNTADWIYKDGWWYYQSPLESGQSTSCLFTSATFSESSGDLGEFSIYVRQESRQSATYENVFEPWKGEI